MRHARLRHGLATLALLLACTLSSAQPAPAHPAPAQPAAAPPAARPIDFGKAAASVTARATEPATDEAARRLQAEDYASQARHLQWQREYERRGWEWHLLSTQMLFGVVILIVFFGLYITYRQFERDYSDWERAQRPQPPAQAGAADAPPDAAAAAPPPRSGLASTLKLSASGLEVTSQVVGLIVLALSLAFFFLYVKDVYPVREVQVTQPSNAEGKSP